MANQDLDAVYADDLNTFEHARDYVQFYVLILVFYQFFQHRNYSLDGVVFAHNTRHVTKGRCYPGSERSGASWIQLDYRWQQKLLDFSVRKIVKAVWHVVDSRKLHFEFRVIQQQRESLNQIVVGYLFSKRFSKVSKVFCKCEPYLPRFVLTSCQQTSKSMNLVFFFG